MVERTGAVVLWGMLLVSLAVAQVELSEFMPNPPGEDDAPAPDGEWVELYNAGTEEINLSGYTLRDRDGHELAVGGDLLQGGVYLIIYRNGARDFSLNNDGDEIYLIDSENRTVDHKSYSGSREGKSWQKVRETWVEGVPSPGAPNEQVNTSADNGMNNGVDNGASENTTPRCDLYLTLRSNSTISEAGKIWFEVQVEGKADGGEADGAVVSVQGRIEDINGEKIKDYTPWTDKEIYGTLRKEYSPQLASGVYALRFWISNLSCEDDNPENNNATLLVAVNPDYKRNESWIGIISLKTGKDEKVAWGEELSVSIGVYKGDETKKAGELFVEQGGKVVSERTKLTFQDRYTRYNLTVPVHLDANCGRKFKDGEALVVLEAFRLRVEQIVRVEGVSSSVCKQTTIKGKQEEKLVKQTALREKGASLLYELVDVPSEVDVGEALRVTLHIQNEEKKHTFRAWGFVYRGSKCYSCEDETRDREENAKTLKLEAGKEGSLSFLLKLDEGMGKGEYKLKVAVQKDNLKTLKELVVPVYVRGGESGLVVQEKAEPVLVKGAVREEEVEQPALRLSQLPFSPGIVIYEANKAKNTIPYFLALTFGLLVIVIGWKKMEKA